MSRILTHIVILSLLGLVVFNGCSLEKPTTTNNENVPVEETHAFLEFTGLHFVLEYFGFYNDRCNHIEHAAKPSGATADESAQVTTTSQR